MARARNIVLAQTHSNIIAITDDDCTVADDWLTSIQNAFLTSPNLAILFGNVLSAEHDTSLVSTAFEELLKPLARGDTP